MSEPVIPETATTIMFKRIREEIEAPLRDKVAELEKNKLDDIERTEMQAATIARQKNDFNLLIDLSNSRLKEIQQQAATIERLTGAMKAAGECGGIVMARRFINAALSKQEPK